MSDQLNPYGPASTNISNYSGVFETGASYSKFDFVYNPQDGLYYYATKDLTIGGELEISGKNRFLFVPDGPVIENQVCHYVYDEWNELGLLNQGLQVGQTINIQGSLLNSNGDYEVLEVEENVDSYYNPVAEKTLISTLGLTAVEGADFWHKSSWFFSPNKGEADEISGGDLNYTSDSLGNWVYNTVIGWFFVSLSDSSEKSFWFFLPHSGERLIDNGVWLWASIDTLGSNVSSSNSFLYLGPENKANDYESYISNDGGLLDYFMSGADWNYGDGTVAVNTKTIAEFGKSHWEAFGLKEERVMPQVEMLGPEGWLHCTKSFLDKYSVCFYNFNNNKWYARLSGGADSFTSIPSDEIAATLNSSKPPSSFVPNRLTDGISARIAVRGVDDSISISQLEEPSDQTIIISSVDSVINSNQDAWTSDRFFFDADYGSTVNFKTNNDKYEFGNGYYSIKPKGINSLSFSADLTFKNRTNREANAIIHFVESHQGQLEKDSSSSNLEYSQGISGFRWGGSSTFHPYDTLDNQSKTFYCDNFSHSLDFENSNNIQLTLKNFNTSLLYKSESLFTKKAEDFDESSYYSRNDVVFYTGNHQYYYFHSGDYSDENIVGPPALMHDEWTRESGYCSEINKDAWTREFYWKPSLGLTVSQSPQLLDMNMNGSYSQIHKDGINNNLLNLELNFNNRDDAEVYAILHFLEQHYGAVPFLFSPPAPYEKKKAFICQEWSHAYNFKNNHSVSARFEQFPIALTSEDIINEIPPAITTKGELIFEPSIEISSQDEQFTWDSVRKKRVYIENIGGTDVEIDYIRLNSEDSAINVLGRPRLGRNYMTPGIPELEGSVVHAKAIFLAIMGFEMSDSLFDDYSESLAFWTARDFVFELINSETFLASSPSESKIQVLYRDLLNRIADQVGMDYFLNVASMSIVVNGLLGSAEYNFAKVMPLNSERRGLLVTIPPDKLFELNLHGKPVKLTSFDGGIQGFETVLDEEVRRFLQYPNGAIKDINLNEYHEYTYFVGTSAFVAYGSNLVPAYSRVYIDLLYDNPLGDVPAFFLEDLYGEIVNWTDDEGNVGGNLKIESTNKWVIGNLEVQVDESIVKGEVKAWVTSNDDQLASIIEEENEGWRSTKKISGPAILSFLDVDYSGWFYQFGNLSGYSKKNPAGIVLPRSQDSDPANFMFKDAINCAAKFKVGESFEVNDYLGLWVTYEFKTFSEQGGGLLSPRSFDPQVMLSSQDSLAIDGSVSLGVCNSANHTLLSIEQMTVESTPNGYAYGWVQKGIMKIHSSFLTEAETFSDESNQNLDTVLLGAEQWLCQANASCFIVDNEGLGNIEFKVGDIAYEYGIVYDSELDNYSVVNKNNDYDAKGVSLDTAYDVLLKTKTKRKAFRKFVMEGDVPCFQIWRHLVRTSTQESQVEDFYASQYLPDGNTLGFPFGQYKAERSALPYLPSSPGIELKLNFGTLDINPRLKAIILKAAETWKSCVLDALTIRVDIVEDTSGDSTLAAVYTHTDLDFTEYGMKPVGKNHLFRSSALLVYNPNFLFTDKWLKEDEDGDSSAGSVAYHEFGHIFGITSMQNKDRLNLYSADTKDLYDHFEMTEKFGAQYIGAKGVEKWKELIIHKGFDDPVQYFYESIPLNEARYFENADGSIGSKEKTDYHISEYPKFEKDGIRVQPTFSEALMTTFLGKGATPTPSIITLGLLEDLGYEVDYGAACSNDDPSLEIDIEI